MIWRMLQKTSPSVAVLLKHDTPDACLFDGIRTHHTRLDIGEQFVVRQVERPRLFACHADGDYLSVGEPSMSA